MASQRFTGNGFSNPLNPIGLHAENQHRELSPLGADYQIYNSENKEIHAENARGNQEYHVPGAGWLGGKLFGRGLGIFGKSGAKKGGAGFFGRMFGKRSAQEGVEGGLSKAAQKKLAKANTKALAAGARSPVRSTMIMTAGAVVVGLYGMNLLGANAETLICSLTGCNCDENAIDAGYEEGTEEYKEDVEECQEAAGNKLEKIAYAGLGVVALIAFFILKPKKKE